MYKNVLQAIEGIAIYPLVSFFIFLALFAVVIIWFFRADKAHLERMAHLPLDNDSDDAVIRHPQED